MAIKDVPINYPKRARSYGAYEEVLLDDSDMSMFNVITALQDAGYEGSLCMDHAP
jgi:hypothetical protein